MINLMKYVNPIRNANDNSYKSNTNRIPIRNSNEILSGNRMKAYGEILWSLVGKSDDDFMKYEKAYQEREW